MRSMTGFGRAQREMNGVRATVEIKTLNHKGLDVKIRLPREVASLELQILARVKSALERGRVEIGVDLAGGPATSFDEDATIQFLDGVRALAVRLDASSVLTIGDILRAALSSGRREGVRDGDSLAPALLPLVDEALDALVHARTAEGASIATAVSARVDAIDALRARLHARTADAPQRLADKLKARVQAAAVELDAARLAQEVALLADRIDVTEELERLSAHVDQARVLLSSSSPGRRLDFLCQEFLREANTLGSKCQDAPTAHLVVELKAEIERMREQVQNAE